MKKFLVFIFLGLLILVPASVLAIDLGTDIMEKTAGTAGYSPETTTDTTFSQTVGLVIKIALSFMGVIFLALMVYAGILWMTAAGEEEKIKKSQKIITASVIGLIIVVSAYSITNYLVPQIIDQGTGQSTYSTLGEVFVEEVAGESPTP
jgi:drug/metabolite transporter (DMT)-like permease